MLRAVVVSGDDGGGDDGGGGDGGADKDRDEDKHLKIWIIFPKDILITVSRHKHFMWEFS